MVVYERNVFIWLLFIGKFAPNFAINNYDELPAKREGAIRAVPSRMERTVHEADTICLWKNGGSIG